MKTKTIRRWPPLAALSIAALVVGGSACGIASAPTVSLPAGSAGDGSVQDAHALDGTWRAISLSAPGAPLVTLAEPGRFTAEFRDARLSLVADCNRCSAGYTAGAGTLVVTPMACTRAYCSSAPADTEFTALVASATSWTISGDELALSSASGTVRLRR